MDGDAGVRTEVRVVSAGLPSLALGPGIRAGTTRWVVKRRPSANPRLTFLGTGSRHPSRDDGAGGYPAEGCSPSFRQEAGIQGHGRRRRRSQRGARVSAGLPSLALGPGIRAGTTGRVATGPTGAVRHSGRRPESRAMEGEVDVGTEGRVVLSTRRRSGRQAPDPCVAPRSGCDERGGAARSQALPSIALPCTLSLPRSAWECQAGARRPVCGHAGSTPSLAPAPEPLRRVYCEGQCRLLGQRQAASSGMPARTIRTPMRCSPSRRSSRAMMASGQRVERSPVIRRSESGRR